MTTILIMLTLLVVPYVVWRRGLIGLALLFVFTASGHFVQTHVMAEMLPPAVPWRTEIIYATGVLELAFAVGLLYPATSRLTAWAIIVFLALALPANIYAALERVPMGAHALGPVYLLARVPLQILIGWWAYRFGVRQPESRPATAPAPTSL